MVASCLEHFTSTGVARELKYYSRSYGGLRDPSVDGSDGSLGGKEKLGGNWISPKNPRRFLC